MDAVMIAGETVYAGGRFTRADRTAVTGELADLLGREPSETDRRNREVELRLLGESAAFLSWLCGRGKAQALLRAELARLSGGSALNLVAQPLTAEAFAPFGEGIMAPTTEKRRYFNEVLGDSRNGAMLLCWVSRIAPTQTLPLRCEVMEHHPCGTRTTSSRR